VHRDLWDLLDFQELKGQPEAREQWALPESLEFKARREPQVSLVRKAQQELQDQLVSQERSELLELRVLRVLGV